MHDQANNEHVLLRGHSPPIAHNSECFDKPMESDNEAIQHVSVREWFYRFRHLNLLAAISVLGGILTSSQLPFIENTAFARDHVIAGTVVDCNDTPKLVACQRGAADMAYWDGILAGTAGVASIFSALALGTLSDNVGRRAIIIVKLALGFLLALSLVAVVMLGWSIWVYLVVETIYQSFDSNGVFLAIVADLTRDQRKDRGPVLGSGIVLILVFACICMPLSASLSYEVAVLLAAACSICALVVAIWVLPETGAVKHDENDSPGFGAFGHDIREAFAILNRHSFMQRMVLVLTISGICFAGKQAILKPYLISHYGLDKKGLAILMPICTPSIVLCFTLGMSKLVPRFGEVRILQLSLLCNSFLTLFTILSATKWQLFATYAVLTGPGMLFLPLINAIKSNLCTDLEQGKVQGLIAAVRSFAVSFANVFFGTLYKWTTNDGQDVDGALNALYIVLSLTFISAALAFTLPTTYPSPHTHGSDAVDGPEVEMALHSAR